MSSWPLQRPSSIDHSKVAGMMTPRMPIKSKPQRSGMRIDESEGGDLSLRGLGAKGVEKKRKLDLEEVRLQAGRDERAEKKRATEQRAAEIDAAFEACLGMRDADGYCTCRPVCDMAKFVRCPVCKAIKKGKCRVGACKAAGAPLLLTGPAPILAINE